MKAIRWQEQQVTERADVVAFVSELDLRRAVRLFQMRATSGVAPIPVDTEYYSPRPIDWVRDPRPIVLFTGHLSHPPNVDAVLYFIQEIWPRILVESPDALLQIVGMIPAPKIKEATASVLQCELHPNVPDIRPYFWNAGVYVVPMRYGGGVRQKLFEAWSMSVPVVCTTMAVEGTDAENGIHCWMEDTPASFADRVVSILNSKQPITLTKVAKEHVEETNSITAAAPCFQKLVESAVRINHQRPFKLLYDLRWMDAVRARGIDQATYELIAAISGLDHRNEYRLFAPRSTCSEWDFPSGFNVSMHYSDPIELKPEVLKSFLVNRLAENLKKPALLNPAMRTLAELRRMDFNLVHSVCNYINTDLIGFPSILTIQDLLHLHYPQFFLPSELERREKLYRESVNCAQRIICTSEFIRHEVNKRYGIPLKNIFTIWSIPSRHVWLKLREHDRKLLLTRMGLSSGEFLFFPADCLPHKNHAMLVEAFSLVTSEIPKDIKLVFTGSSFPSDHAASKLIREYGLSKRIVHLGHRSGFEMRALFQSCLGLVFPSLFEGYSMSVVEALIAGKPIACSNVTSLPEIAGDAAITFNPNDVAEIGASLVKMTTQPDLLASLANAAVRRRGLFSAQRQAIQTLAVYHSVHEDIYGS